MVDDELCNKCKTEKFDDRGVALTRGLIMFTCVNCHGRGASYAHGQNHLCHACARKLGLCVMCGNGVNNK